MFRDTTTARAAADAVRRANLPQVSVELADHSDELAAIRGEMYDEMSHTIVGPGNVGPFTREMTRGLLGGIVLGGAIGAVIAAPLGLFAFGGLSLGVRLIVAAAIGALAGSAWGFFAGGAGRWEVAVEGRELATERGVTVGIWVRGNEARERASQILSDYEPIRVDQVTPEGGVLRTVATEEGDRPA